MISKRYTLTPNLSDENSYASHSSFPNPPPQVSLLSPSIFCLSINGACIEFLPQFNCDVPITLDDKENDVL